MNTSSAELRDHVVRFRLPDPQRTYAAVGLLQDLRRPRDWTEMQRRGGVWTVDFPVGPVDRAEYQFKVVHRDGREEVICDPANPLRAPGAFGDKSEIRVGEYRPPIWLQQRCAGDVLRAPITSARLRTDVEAWVWSAPGTDVERSAPLLIVHDGPEYRRFSALLTFLTAMVDTGQLPPCRAALLAPPPPRDEHYSASALYARAMATEILPALEWLAPTPHPRLRVAMGASLGALAMLHLHRTRSGTFGGLFLQSGSFFRQRWDRHEAGFPRFRRITRFVGEVLNAATWPDPVPTVITCGAVEENLANNRAVAAALQRQGYHVDVAVNRDAHNYTGWRDTFDPHLRDLLIGVWGDGPAPQ